MNPEPHFNEILEKVERESLRAAERALVRNLRAAHAFRRHPHSEFKKFRRRQQFSEVFTAGMVLVCGFMILYCISYDMGALLIYACASAFLVYDNISLRAAIGAPLGAHVRVHQGEVDGWTVWGRHVLTRAGYPPNWLSDDASYHPAQFMTDSAGDGDDL